MARRKKGGGRYTPKSTRPRNWDDNAASGPARHLSLVREPAPSAAELGLVELLAPAEDLLDATPSLRQLEALFIAADIDSGFDPLSPASIVAQRRQFIEMLAEFAPGGPQTLVDTLFIVGLYWDDCGAQARNALAKVGRSPSPAVLDLGTAKVIGGHYAAHELGDLIELAVQIGYDSGETVMISAELMPVSEQLRDVFIADGLPADVMVAADELGVSIHDLSGEDAAAHLAYSVHQLDLSALPHASDGYEQAEHPQHWLRTYLPLVARLTEGVTARSLGVWPDVDLDDLEDVISECVAWVADHEGEAKADFVSEWADTAFAVCRVTGGGWDRWSPTRAATLWRFALQPPLGASVPRTASEMMRFASAVPSIIRWGHDRAGWGNRWLADTLEAHEIESAQAVGLSDSARSGHDADLSRLDGTALTVATLAGHAARRVFDDEMASIVQRIVVDVDEHEPDLMARGKPEIWASSVVYAAAQLNSFFDYGSSLSMYADELVDELDGAKGTLVPKAKVIRDALGGPTWEYPEPYEHSLRHDVWRDRLAAMKGGGAASYVRSGAALGVVRVDEHSDRTFMLCVVLDDFEPTVWREIGVGADVTLNGLHHILQVAMGWEDRHLYRFMIGGVEYESDVGREFADEVSDAPRLEHVSLGNLVDVGDTFAYNYDYGDNWQLTIEVMAEAKRGADSLRAVLTGGERSGPPEDVGGTWGFQDFCEALADPQHPEHREFSAWAPPGYDPEVLDVDAIGRALADLTLRW